MAPNRASDPRNYLEKMKLGVLVGTTQTKLVQFNIFELGKQCFFKRPQQKRHKELACCL